MLANASNLSASISVEFFLIVSHLSNTAVSAQKVSPAHGTSSSVSSSYNKA